MQSDPFHAFYFRNVADEISDMLFAINVYTIISELLSNYLKFFDSICNQTSYFLQYVFFWTTYMTSCY